MLAFRLKVKRRLKTTKFMHQLPTDLPLLAPPAQTPSTSSPITALQTYLSSLPTTTSVSSSVRMLTRLLLLHVARCHSASHVVLGTSLTAFSVNLISGIAQGEGFAVREQAGEEWSAGKVRVCRPLKEVGMKECAAYVWWCGLSVLIPGTWDVAEGKKDIHGMTRGMCVCVCVVGESFSF
jgi:cytoplasmic tRNA 2-thiolation protein 2